MCVCVLFFFFPYLSRSALIAASQHTDTHTACLTAVSQYPSVCLDGMLRMFTFPTVYLQSLVVFKAEMVPCFSICVQFGSFFFFAPNLSLCHNQSVNRLNFIYTALFHAMHAYAHTHTQRNVFVHLIIIIKTPGSHWLSRSSSSLSLLKQAAFKL